MFVDEDLQNHLETSSTIKTQSAIIAEWNLNVSENIKLIGNYRHRPTADEADPYKRIAATFSENDPENFYTGATDADVKVDGGVDDAGIPVTFLSKQEKEKLLYSLEDCFARFRPRSGINKLRYFGDKYLQFQNEDMARRPRYYPSDPKDQFKYWTSYRQESGTERGIANINVDDQFYIDDAAPFIVFKNSIPTNRIVVKVQTHVGDVPLGVDGQFQGLGGAFSDPFFGDSNKATPVRWAIEYLDQNDNWTKAHSFDSESVRNDGSPIIGPDGYVEIGYGLLIPEEFRTLGFSFAGEYAAVSLLPSATAMRPGTAFLVKTGSLDRGTYYIVDSINNNATYRSFPATYSWQVESDEITNYTNYATTLVSPPSFMDSATGSISYREFQYINGLRVVVDTMNVYDSTLDLIELSPRLSVNLSDKVTSVSITKNASDLGISGMPVGQLLASTGTLSIFDYDQAFLAQNTNSILSSIVTQNIQVKVYDITTDVEVNGVLWDYYIPVKTMYVDGFPVMSLTDRTVDITLRDLFFYFESLTAPRILIQNASLSSAIALLLDNVGFSNYVFKRNPDEAEIVIPYFYIEPDVSIAEILSQLAVSAQAAMFFDEYNNLVVMSKNYIMPTELERPTDVVLYGSIDSSDEGILENGTFDNTKLTNIIEISSQNNDVYNDGIITYSTKYIQKSYGSVRQASMIDKGKTWIYKPSLLWEVGGEQSSKSVNDLSATQSDYSLAAIPLSSSLSTVVPSVEGNRVVNNIIDLGDGVYWLSRYNGYFYANGEVIKYDAVEYSVSGLSSDQVALNNGSSNVWISNVQEYQRYFSKVSFNGKIYPTGRVRIFSEPNYITEGSVTKLRNGEVAKHGRGQFGTTVVPHPAGVSNRPEDGSEGHPWDSEEYLYGMSMDTKYLFDQNVDVTVSGVVNETVSRGTVSMEYLDLIGTEVSISGATIEEPALKTTVNRSRHGFVGGDTFYFNTDGALPTGLSKYRIYTVISVTNINSFTFGESSTEISLSTEDLATQSGSHSVKILSGLGATSYGTTISSGSPAVPAVFTTTVNHGLVIGQAVKINSTGLLPTNISQDVVYIVDSVITVKKFTLKTIDQAIIQTVAGASSGSHSFRYVKLPIVVYAPNHRFAAGGLAKFSTSTSGILSTNLYHVDYAGLTPDTFTLMKTTTISGAVITKDTVRGVLNAAVITRANHDLPENSVVFFKSTGQELPFSLSFNKRYYVINALTDSFSLSLSPSINSIPVTATKADGVTEYSLNAYLPSALSRVSPTAYGPASQSNTLSTVYTTQDVRSILVVPDASLFSPGFLVEKSSGNGVIASNTIITEVDVARNTITISPATTISFSYNQSSSQENAIRIYDSVQTELGAAGIDLGKARAKTTTRNGVIKNFMSEVYVNDSSANKLKTTEAGTIQSSALILNGSSAISTDTSPKFITYVYKKLEDRFKHFGTRMRIIGQISNNETRGQSPDGLKPYYTTTESSSDQAVSIGGASGGLGIFVNPTTNNGYYFELAALTENNTSSYIGSEGIHNVLFYKIKRNATLDSAGVSSISDTSDAIPIKLWGGNANIICDDGLFTGQYRLVADENPTVYDMSVEYETIGSSIRFYLYINNSLVAVVDDSEPLPITSGMALFTRSSSRVMFENVYALAQNYSQNTVSPIGTIKDSTTVFGDRDFNTTTAFQKYAMSGMVQQAYLSGISSTEYPQFNMYFDEFGTIMREGAYLNVRYDKAYPALSAKLAPTFNKIKGYVTSGFYADAYGAEFMVFNSTDTAINLDSTSGNYLRILGVTFTQNSDQQLSVDDYFDKVSDFSNPQYDNSTNKYSALGQSEDTLDLIIDSAANDPRSVGSPLKSKKDFYDIRFSRITHGRKQFNISTKYIQSQDDANDLMAWMVKKVMKPRKAVGVKVFSMPTLQLGDIVEFNHKSSEGVDQVAISGTRFVVYSIQYDKDISGPSMIVYLSEVK